MCSKTHSGKTVNLVRSGIEVSLILFISVLFVYAPCLAGQGEISLTNPVWKGVLKQTAPKVAPGGNGSFQASEETVSSYDEFYLSLIRNMRSKKTDISICFVQGSGVTVNEFLGWNDCLLKELSQEVPWLFWSWTNMYRRCSSDAQGLVTQATYSIDYWYGEDEEDALETGLKATVRDLISPDMDMVTREKAVHKWVANHVEYDYSLERHSDYDAYMGSAVCEGYSVLTDRMLSMAGIPDLIISGYANGDHSWNLVNVCGGWFHLDVTWDDPDWGEISYDYFNQSDWQMRQKDHTWDENNYPSASQVFDESTCQGEIEHRCSIFEPELCDTELKCIKISGIWCGDHCGVDGCPQILLAAPEMPLPALSYSSYVDPEENVIAVPAGQVLLQPSIQVPVEDRGKEATLFVYIYLPDLGVGIDFYGTSQVILDDVTSFDGLFPYPVDLSGEGGLVFCVYYGYLFSDGALKYNAYTVQVS
ncbi:MAG: hypothetical protein J7K15_07430 [Deltaproteobacteria bacterium]|nr:hypothetical protein [Deltaproteobacteria bacterium]